MCADSRLCYNFNMFAAVASVLLAEGSREFAMELGQVNAARQPRLARV
jgi:hypothetical protein